jgi:glycine/D-amino acid oxidase-like deaminating enzyme
MQQDRFEKYISLWQGPPPFPLNEKGVSAGRIDHVLQINKEKMLDSFCREYKQEGILTEKVLVYDMIRQAKDGWIYQDQQYDALVFCDGYKIQVNPYFSWVPIEPTKGEVIMAHLEGPPAHGILKHHCFVIPWDDGTYWVGSNYEKEPIDPEPDPEQQTALEGRLSRSVGSGYKVIKRRAGIRPASQDRRPILGQHPEWKGIYLLNGLGTKGTLLGPYFASQLIGHMVDGTPIDDEVNVSRWYPLYRERGMPGR